MGINLLEQSVGRGWNPKTACAVALSLVFLCGAAAGALAMNLGHSRLHQQATFDTAVGKTLVFERMQKELQLTPAQSEQIQSVLNDFWQYYRTVLSESKTRVEQLLTEEQRKKFERLLQERQRP
jgi:uncharacterized membrane-anchored protein YhcB (DUF1043 family)